MTTEKIHQHVAHLKTLSDADLRAFMAQAEIDNFAAATADKDSDWHQSCFAALYVACLEASDRGLAPQPTGVIH